MSLRWRHNDHAGVSNHQPHGCLLNRLFRRNSKKTSKLRVTGLCAGNSPGTGEFPAQMASYAENGSIWWRHHVLGNVITAFDWVSCVTMPRPITDTVADFNWQMWSKVVTRSDNDTFCHHIIMSAVCLRCYHSRLWLLDAVDIGCVNGMAKICIIDIAKMTSTQTQRIYESILHASTKLCLHFEYKMKKPFLSS